MPRTKKEKERSVHVMETDIADQFKVAFTTGHEFDYEANHRIEDTDLEIGRTLQLNEPVFSPTDISDSDLKKLEDMFVEDVREVSDEAPLLIEDFDTNFDFFYETEEDSDKIVAIGYKFYYKLGKK